MKALTIQQPWAWAVAAGGKDIENRTWGSAVGGPLAIHAGKARDDAAGDHPLIVEAFGRVFPLPPKWPTDAERDEFARRWDSPASRAWAARGAVVAVADVAGLCLAGEDVEWCECGPWAVPGQVHWQLGNVRLLDRPVPARGAQGLWTLPADVEAAVREQLAVPA